MSKDEISNVLFSVETNRVLEIFFQNAKFIIFIDNFLLEMYDVSSVIY